MGIAAVSPTRTAVHAARRHPPLRGAAKCSECVSVHWKAVVNIPTGRCPQPRHALIEPGTGSSPSGNPPSPTGRGGGQERQATGGERATGRASAARSQGQDPRQISEQGDRRRGGDQRAVSGRRQTSRRTQSAWSDHATIGLKGSQKGGEQCAQSANPASGRPSKRPDCGQRPLPRPKTGRSAARLKGPDRTAPPKPRAFAVFWALQARRPSRSAIPCFQA